ncbi:3-deoxy-7-phosphoheptulonate synthase [Aliikangiella marina]|uniref:Phospho-2-dehydro-3-deoxyheptonate aldolase n=1 Tax=Aliikangiella marina TaxID=1712262 RepID=A0A545TA33_9GAMM|nr:3-deoxy-7-phosphoheptulonate synthase class II [Aliikangiella marina]TQV74068.1 3-deoxy-7-phosphoheptulonate synthase [Aliikangiella marina]
MRSWQPDTWQNFQVSQQANYTDTVQLTKVIDELSLLPPLVGVNEIEELRAKVAEAAKGEAFILQGGDCAELFADCNADVISSKLKILLQMSLVLVHGLNKPVIKVGRMAGQYAKPRSTETETIDGISLPSYRGDLINSANFNPRERAPDPRRLLKGYSFASLTLNYIRTLVENKFADFSLMDSWDLDFVAHSPFEAEYHQILTHIRDSIALVDNLTQDKSRHEIKDRIYTCHEALHLHYEQALTRLGDNGNWYNLSTHLPWIGMRTAQLNSAHVEYMRGIANPVGIKISSNCSPEQLLKLCDQLDPDNAPGRLLLITRFGNKNIQSHLPKLITAIKSQGRTPLWCCDPMHGNTSVTSQGVKTRRFDAIIDELSQAFVIHKEMDSQLGGVHFELTGEHVTECIGGARGLTEFDLNRAYKSLVDPRLNADQSLEMAMRIVQLNQKLSLKNQSNNHPNNLSA